MTEPTDQIRRRDERNTYRFWKWVVPFMVSAAIVVAGAVLSVLLS